MRRQVGSRASSAAISAGVDGTFALWMTAPFRPMTQTCVSAIETSSPAKYSIVGLLFAMTEPILSASAEEPPTITRVNQPTGHFGRPIGGAGGHSLGIGADLIRRPVDHCACGACLRLPDRAASLDIND